MQTFLQTMPTQLPTKNGVPQLTRYQSPGTKISEASVSERHGSWVYAPIACAVDLGFVLSRFSVRVMGA